MFASWVGVGDGLLTSALLLLYSSIISMRNLCTNLPYISQAWVHDSILAGTWYTGTDHLLSATGSTWNMRATKRRGGCNLYLYFDFSTQQQTGRKSSENIMCDSSLVVADKQEMDATHTAVREHEDINGLH